MGVDLKHKVAVSRNENVKNILSCCVFVWIKSNFIVVWNFFQASKIETNVVKLIKIVFEFKENSCALTVVCVIIIK